MENDIKESFEGAILGCAAGDAIGFPVEFLKNLDEIKAIYGPDGITELTDGLYSDDTQMTICIAQSLINAKPRIVSSEEEEDADIDTFMDEVSKSFVQWHKSQSNPQFRRAPGNTCLRACKALGQGVSWRESGIKEGKGCGSAMRSSPIGLYFSGNIPKIVRFGLSSGIVTHNDPDAGCSAVATALITSLAASGVPIGIWGHELLVVTGPISEALTDLIKMATELAATEGVSPERVLSNEYLGEGWMGHEAVASALYCCLKNPNSFKDAIVMAANTVGDSDSIACIAGAWMGAKLGVKSIPESWLGKLENKDKLLLLADELYDATVL